MLRANKIGPVSAQDKPSLARRRSSYKNSIDGGDQTDDRRSSENGTAAKFRIIVKDKTFDVNPERMSHMSPVFASACKGETTEIVDEKVEDMDTFLQCLDEPGKIDQWNFGTILRLSEKYAVGCLLKECGQFILRTDLTAIKPDQILTLLMATHEARLELGVIGQLVLRLASEDSTTFNVLKINRYLPTPLYSAVIGTSLNLRRLTDQEKANGHVFRFDKGKVVSKRTLCEMCKQITADVSRCGGCMRTMCKTHWTINPCSSDYGKRMLAEMRTELIDWNGYVP